MTINHASRFTLLFSVALETSRAGMECECRNNRSIADVAVRPPSAGGAARIGGASFAKLIHSVHPSAQTTVFKRTVATLGRMMGRKDWIIGSLEGFQRGVRGHRARGGGLLRDKYWPPPPHARNLSWISTITLPRGLSVITVPCHLSNGPNNRRLRSDKVRPVY